MTKLEKSSFLFFGLGLLLPFFSQGGKVEPSLSAYAIGALLYGIHLFKNAHNFSGGDMFVKLILQISPILLPFMVVAISQIAKSLV